MFAPFHGVYEDPATGSNAACLAAYLRVHELIPDSGDGWVKLDQGYSLQRPSALFVQANESGGKIDVRIAGQCVEVIKGEISL
jgi:trans-2,3-dihydro-3-hydroxyanthranilate isomerase